MDVCQALQACSGRSEILQYLSMHFAGTLAVHPNLIVQGPLCVLPAGCYHNLFRLMAKVDALENLLAKEHAHTFVNSGGDVRLLDFRFKVGGQNIGAPFHGEPICLACRLRDLGQDLPCLSLLSPRFI